MYRCTNLHQDYFESPSLAAPGCTLQPASFATSTLHNERADPPAHSGGGVEQRLLHHPKLDEALYGIFEESSCLSQVLPHVSSIRQLQIPVVEAA